MNFQDLREANIQRQDEWPGAENADLAFRALEVAGEAGEVAEAVKKYLRAQRGIRGSEMGAGQIGDEIADCIIALDLLAHDLGLNLGPLVRRKFNRTSEKYGLATRIGATEVAP